MKIPFTDKHLIVRTVNDDPCKFHMVKEVEGKILGKKQAQRALADARRGGPAHARRKALRRASRAVDNLRIVENYVETEVCRKQRPIGRLNPMPIP